MERLKPLLLTTLLLCLSWACHGERLAPELTQQKSVPVQSETGAEILYARQRVEVQPDLSWRVTGYFSIRINDLQAARDYGRIQLGYNDFYSDLTLDFANVLSPNGDVKPLKSDAIQTRTGGSQDFYDDSSTLVFSLPDIVPGAIIEFQFQQSSRKIAMPGLFSASARPYWYQPTVGGDGGRLDPVIDADYRIDYPADITLFTKAVGNHSPQHSRQRRDGREIAQWHWRDLPAIPIESAQETVDKLMPRVRISTLKDWSAVTEWSRGLTEDKFIDQPLAARTAAGLVDAQADRDARIRAVYQYLQNNVRYVFAHLGRGGYEPHFADEVIQQGYGDCKDQTILAVALLRSLGIDAYPALIVTPRNSRPDTEVVSLFFDHMIVFIPAADQQPAVWMDTTPDHALYPGLSNILVNQWALVTRPGNGTLETVNDYLPDNSVQLDLVFSVDKRDHLLVTADISMSGIYEQGLRHWWIHSSQRETELEQLVSQIFVDLKSNVKLTSQVVNQRSLWQPIGIEATFDFGERENTEEPISYGAALSQVYRLFGNFSSMQLPRERKTRWVNELEQHMNMTALFRGRDFDVPMVIKSGTDFSSPYFAITQQGHNTDDGAYRVDIHFTQPPLDLSVAQYGEYYKSLQNLDEAASHWLVNFVEDRVEEQRQALAARGDDSTAALLEKVRFHLENGEFELALKPAQSAVVKSNNNGEAWYLLGLAQGYNAMLSESKKSFEKAATLGYQP